MSATTSTLARKSARALGDGEQPVLAGLPVAQPQVEQDQLDSGVSMAATRSSASDPAGTGTRERPPQLDGIEAGCRGGRGPLQQRQVRPEDGEVGVEARHGTSLVGWSWSDRWAGRRRDQATGLGIQARRKATACSAARSGDGKGSISTETQSS